MCVYVCVCVCVCVCLCPFPPLHAQHSSPCRRHTENIVQVTQGTGSWCMAGIHWDIPPLNLPTRSPLISVPRSLPHAPSHTVSNAQVPQGSTPRSLTVHLRGELTRTCKPGDSVTMSAIFLPEPAARGFAAMRVGLTTQCFLEAMTVVQDKQSYDMVALDDKLRDEIEVLKSLPSQRTKRHTTPPHPPHTLIRGKMEVIR